MTKHWFRAVIGLSSALTACAVTVPPPPPATTEAERLCVLECQAQHATCLSGGTSADGPIVVGPTPGGPVRPQPYDGSSGSVAAAVSEVFTGQGTPLRDLGFVAITPYLPAVVVPTVACCCSTAAGCPE